MAAASTTATAIFIFSLLFCSTFSNACIPCGQSPPPPKPKPPPAPKPKSSPPPPAPKPKPPPAPKPKSSPPPPAPKPKPPPAPKPKSSPPPPAPKPKPPPAPKPKPTPMAPPVCPPPPMAPPPMSLMCPKDTLKLGSCTDLLGGIVGIVVGTPASSKCCALLSGLADLEAAVCLCTAIKANVLGINLNVPITLSLIISACEKSVPPGFKCE